MGGGQEGQGNPPKSPQGRGPQKPGRRGQIPGQIGPESAHDAQGHGVVVKDVGQQKEPDGLLHLDRWALEPEQAHQEAVQQSSPPQEGLEGGGGDHGGQNKGDGREGLDEGFAPEVEVGENIGPRQGQEQSQEGGEQSLPEGEPQHPGVIAGLDQLDQISGSSALLPPKAQSENGGQGIKVEYPQENQNRYDQQKPYPGSHLRTASVHPSIHFSREAPIFSGSSRTGSSVTRVCFTKTSGRGVSSRAGKTHMFRGISF